MKLGIRFPAKLRLLASSGAIALLFNCSPWMAQNAQATAINSYVPCYELNTMRALTFEFVSSPSSNEYLDTIADEWTRSAFTQWTYQGRFESGWKINESDVYTQYTPTKYLAGYIRASHYMNIAGVVSLLGNTSSGDCNNSAWYNVFDN